MKIPALFLLLVIISCTSEQPKNDKSIAAKNTIDSSANSVYPELLQKSLKAHGGIEKWKGQRMLKYDVITTLGSEKRESQLIDLNTRKVLIKGSNYTIGMDGEKVWIAPDKEAFGQMPARFYHNLIFYFFAMPFVLADPGIQYEDLGNKTIEGKAYRALKITFNEGIGDTDEDLYVAHFDPETYRLELLLYTVTYFSGEKNENYNALRYSQWQEVNGLLVPLVMEGYKYADNTIGELRYRAEFSDITFKEDAPDHSVFTMPEKAEIDSLQSD